MAWALQTFPAHADSRCQSSVAQPYVTVKSKPGGVRYFNDHDQDGLSRMHGQRGRARAGWSPIGLTLADFSLGIGVTVRSQEISSGRFCAELSAVEASIGFDSIDVYIARDYAPGSCQYDSVLHHEHQHVAVFQDTLNIFAPRIETSLRRAATRAEPVYSRDRERAVSRLQRELERAVKPLFGDIERMLDRRNSALDTEENYRNEQKNCAKW